MKLSVEQRLWQFTISRTHLQRRQADHLFARLAQKVRVVIGHRATRIL
jgi:hypothetical protein